MQRYIITLPEQDTDEFPVDTLAECFGQSVQILAMMPDVVSISGNLRLLVEVSNGSIEPIVVEPVSAIEATQRSA